jgi:choline dehydrogenase-like flavoprotein
MWLVNPTIGDPLHGNGALSFSYLMLRSPLGRFLVSNAIRKAAIASDTPPAIAAHVLNMVRDLPRTLGFIPTFGIKRFLLRRKVPGFFQYAHSNIYPLHYHGEQVPNLESRVWLSEKRDSLGMKRLNIDLRFSEKDVESVVRAHHLLDQYLQQHGAGRLKYLCDDLHESVWRQATDGFHQAGTTRMSGNPSSGVVDDRCCVHGLENLFVASSSIFVTSSQANSTFMIVAFAIRLAEYMAKQTQSVQATSLQSVL